MRTQRTSRWLLTDRGPQRGSRAGVALWLSLVILLPAVSILGQAGGDTALVAAARNDDIQAVRALIARRANVNEHARDGSTAILWAAYHSNLEMTRALIAAGAAVNTPNHYGITPLLQASRSGDAPLVAALLKAGADPAATHPDGETPLMAASRTGRVDTVRLLLDAGVECERRRRRIPAADSADVGGGGRPRSTWSRRCSRRAPIRIARRHVNALEERKHADHTTGGFTALMFAVRNGHEEVARALIKGGADPNADQRRRRHRDDGRHRQRSVRSGQPARSTSAPTRTTGRCTSPSTCTTPRPTCARATGRACAPITPTN